MIPIWVVVGLGAQFFWVLSAIIDRYLIEKYFRAEDGTEEGVGALVLFSSFFAVFLSIGALLFDTKAIDFSLQTAIFGTCMGLINTLWVLLYLHAIEKTEISRAVPVFQTIPIFGFIFGWLFLTESLTMLQFIGSLTIIIGALLLSYNFSLKKFLWVPTLLMLGASVLIALQEVLFKIIALDTNFLTSVFWLGIGFALGGTLLYLTQKRYRTQFHSLIRTKTKSIIGANVFNEVIDTTGNLLISFAVILGPIALVQSLNAYQPLLLLIVSYITVFFFGNYLDEDISKQALIQKIIGISVITLGSFVLYSSLVEVL